MFAFNTNAQNDLWPNEPVNTGTNATYLVNSVTFNGDDLLYGKIGAFFINDLGSYQCGGFVVWSGESNSISVQADDATTEEKDGFESGDEIIWLGTNDDGATTYEASVTYEPFFNQLGSSIYEANSVNVISSFTISNTQYCINDADGDGICDENESTGCMDPGAFNYNPDAEVDDGSCIDIILGCTDENADNYNSLANTDDGTCSIAGCMNIEAQNYNLAATVDDGTCIIAGCTDENAFNYNANATVNDDSCIDTINIEYDTVPTNNSINYIIIDNSLSLTLGDSEIITDEDIIGAFQIINGELVCHGYNPWEEDFAIALWLDDPLTEEIDGYTSSEPTYWIANQTSTGVNYLLEVTINESNIITNITLNSSITLGCTDENAFNYTNGVIEDGSCIPVVEGCTNENYVEYNPSANVDDDSCITLAIFGCMDNNYLEFNSDANVDDGSCVNLIVEGCMDENACGYDDSANTDDGSCYTLSIEISISDINTFSVNASSTNSNDILTNAIYTWFIDVGDGFEVTSGVINGQIFVNGDYYVSVIDDLGCEQSSSAVEGNLTVNEVIDNNIVIYPNPANSVINITSNNSNIKSFDLYNTIGELMVTKSQLNSKLIAINKNELKSGVYISKITDANGNSVFRNIIFE